MIYIFRYYAEHSFDLMENTENKSFSNPQADKNVTVGKLEMREANQSLSLKLHPSTEEVDSEQATISFIILLRNLNQKERPHKPMKGRRIPCTLLT